MRSSSALFLAFVLLAVFLAALPFAESSGRHHHHHHSHLHGRGTSKSRGIERYLLSWSDFLLGSGAKLREKYLGFFSGEGERGGGEARSLAAKGAAAAWPCCDNCGGCTKSIPPQCQCMDARPAGCHPACKSCVKSSLSVSPPVYQCMDRIPNLCQRRCTAAARWPPPPPIWPDPPASATDRPYLIKSGFCLSLFFFFWKSWRSEEAVVPTVLEVIGGSSWFQVYVLESASSFHLLALLTTE